MTGLALPCAVAAARAARRGALKRKVARSFWTQSAPPAPVPPPFDPAAQVGAVAPLGFFDPLGLSRDRGEINFRILREAELKHGRVAMLASVGLVGQHYVQFPGFDGEPSGLGAIFASNSNAAFLLFAMAGVAELSQWKQDPTKEVGDFGNPLGIPMYNLEMRNKELNNGRFAMICVVGIVAAELATGKDAIQQLGF